MIRSFCAFFILMWCCKVCWEVIPVNSDYFAMYKFVKRWTWALKEYEQRNETCTYMNNISRIDRMKYVRQCLFLITFGLAFTCSRCQWDLRKERKKERSLLKTNIIVRYHLIWTYNILKQVQFRSYRIKQNYNTMGIVAAGTQMLCQMYNRKFPETCNNSDFLCVADIIVTNYQCTSMMMRIAFIIFNSSLVPLIEGLWSSKSMGSWVLGF